MLRKKALWQAMRQEVSSSFYLPIEIMPKLQLTSQTCYYAWDLCCSEHKRNTHRLCANVAVFNNIGIPNNFSNFSLKRCQGLLGLQGGKTQNKTEEATISKGWELNSPPTISPGAALETQEIIVQQEMCFMPDLLRGPIHLPRLTCLLTISTSCVSLPAF